MRTRSQLRYLAWYLTKWSEKSLKIPKLSCCIFIRTCESQRSKSWSKKLCLSRVTPIWCFSKSSTSSSQTSKNKSSKIKDMRSSPKRDSSVIRSLWCAATTSIRCCRNSSVKTTCNPSWSLWSTLKTCFSIRWAPTTSNYVLTRESSLNSSKQWWSTEKRFRWPSLWQTTSCLSCSALPRSRTTTATSQRLSCRTNFRNSWQVLAPIQTNSSWRSLRDSSSTVKAPPCRNARCV